MVPRASIGDLEMYYETHGNGPPLVMIMGLSGNADHWDPPVIRAFARHFSVIVFDNRDAGRTIGPDKAYTIKDMAGDAVGLIEHLGFEKVHVLGLSMGGMIAQEMALGHPAKIDRLILASTTCGMARGIPPSPEVVEVLTTMRAGSSVTAAVNATRIAFAPGWLLRHFYRLPELAGRFGRHPARPEGYARQLGAIGSFDSAARLGLIKAPTLILHGDRDILLPPENGHILAGLIPGSRLVIIPGCAHMFTTENPRFFRDSVLEFLGVAG